MICSGDDILRLISEEPFAGEPCAPEIVRFVSVLGNSPRALPVLPLSLPAGEEWLVKIVAVRESFAFGLYKRRPGTISVFSQIEKYLGTSITTRNWNTFVKLLQLVTTQIRDATVPSVATS
jgi:uncharacterized protein (DUF1697 family)